MQVNLLVFDWDQTLWDSWEVHREGIWYAAEKGSFSKPSVTEIVTTIGGSLEHEFQRLFPGGDGTVGHYLDFYFRHYLTLGKVFPGVTEVLHHLRGEGFLLALISNKRRSAGIPELEHSGLFSLFHTVLFREDLGRLKPEPDGLQRVLARAGVAHQKALYVGDTAEDIRCAHSAGTGSVAALWGSLDTATLLAQEPDLVWTRIEDALAITATE